MAWYHAVVESRHDLQNPTSHEKIRLLGERLGLGPDARVLDLASGRAGPALVLAAAFGCRITCVERSEEFHAAAVSRVLEADLGDRIELVHADAHSFDAEPASYDAVLCLGASFVWDGLDGTLAAVLPAARPGGAVVVGEPYWRRWPLPDGFSPSPDEQFTPLPAMVERFSLAGLEPLTLIDASRDDWDRYESLHWLAAEEWLRAHPDDPDAPDIRTRVTAQRERYLRWERDLLGWAIVAGRKAAP